MSIVYNSKISRNTLLIAYFIYAFFSFLVLFFHEPWRDEIQAYLLANNSLSLIDLYKNTRYEGHPLLWFLVLYSIKFFNSSIWTVKIVHWVIINIAVILLMFRSKINYLWKILIPFGYYFMYEYNVIFRNYGIGILCLFLGLFFIERKKWFWVAISLVFCFQCNFFIFILASILWFFVFINHIKEAPKTIILNSLIVLVGILFSIFSVLPPSDSGFANTFNFNWTQLEPVIQCVTRAIIILPKIQYNFWNSTCLGSREMLITGGALLLFFTVYFFNFRKTGLFFILTMVAIGSFLGIKYMGYIRHQGHFYIILIASLWLNSIYYYSKKFKFQPFFNLVITCIFILQIYSSFIAIFFDYHHKFSQGITVGNYLNKIKTKNTKFVAEADYTASTICGVLKEPIYSLNATREATYVKWDSKRWFNVTDSFTGIILDSFSKKNQVILIKNNSFETIPKNIIMVEQFSPDICGGESYYIYKFKTN